MYILGFVCCVFLVNKMVGGLNRKKNAIGIDSKRGETRQEAYQYVYVKRTVIHKLSGK